MYACVCGDYVWCGEWRQAHRTGDGRDAAEEDADLLEVLLGHALHTGKQGRLAILMQELERLAKDLDPSQRTAIATYTQREREMDIHIHKHTYAARSLVRPCGCSVASACVRVLDRAIVTTGICFDICVCVCVHEWGRCARGRRTFSNTATAWSAWRCLSRIHANAKPNCVCPNNSCKSGSSLICTPRHTERERDRERYTCTYVYIYACIHTATNTSMVSTRGQGAPFCVGTHHGTQVGELNSTAVLVSDEIAGHGQQVRAQVLDPRHQRQRRLGGHLPTPARRARLSHRTEYRRWRMARTCTSK
jgi:hypothetical protein